MLKGNRKFLRLHYLKPTVIVYYRRPSIALKVLKKRRGCIGCKTIRIWSWGFSQIVFFAFTTSIQWNWHNLELDAGYKEEVKLIRTTSSRHKVWIVLIGSVLILPYRLSKYYVGSRQLNGGRSDSEHPSMLLYFEIVPIWTLNRGTGTVTDSKKWGCSAGVRG